MGWLWQGPGPGLGRHETTYEKEEVENEEEVLDEAEAAVLGRHLRLEGRVTRKGVGSGETERSLEREEEAERQRERKNTEKEEVPGVEPHLLPLHTRWFYSVSVPISLNHPTGTHTHQYLRGLGICGHQVHAGQFLLGLHDPSWGLTGTPDLPVPTYSGHQDPRLVLDSSRPHRHSDLIAC